MKYYVIFKQILVIDGWGISCEIVLIWMSLDFTDDQSTLVQVMAWCRQAASHYLSQCWPRSLSPYGVTRPQWVNISILYMSFRIADLRLQSHLSGANELNSVPAKMVESTHILESVHLWNTQILMFLIIPSHEHTDLPISAKCDFLN